MSTKYKPEFKTYLEHGGDFGRVAVLYGGTSAERDVSLKSGRAVSAGLRAEGLDVVELDIGTEVIAQLLECDFDRAFIALHGAGGEDGKVQAVLQLLNKPFTGSLHTASAIAMDKLSSKRLFISENLSTPAFGVLKGDTNFADLLQSLGGSVFVKPVHEGSSIGMCQADTNEELLAAYKQAAEYDSEVLVESTIRGREFTVAILNGVALPPIELKTDNAFYDYDAKYISNATRYLCPCDLSEQKLEELKTLALRAFNVLGCRNWGRVDVLQDEQEKFYLLEVNTVPGMTDHSLVPMAAKQAGLSFSELVCEILMQTVQA